MNAPGSRLWLVSCLAFRAISWCLGQRSVVIGLENLPQHGGYILAPKHQYVTDPPLISVAFSRPTYFMAKIELFKLAVFRWYLGQIAVFPVDRDDPQSGSEATSLAIQLASAGKPVAIFPEGGRYPGIGMGELHEGLVLIARRARVPVIPLAIGYKPNHPKLFGRGQRWLVVIGPPVSDQSGITHGKGCRLTTEDLSLALSEVTVAAVTLAESM